MRRFFGAFWRALLLTLRGQSLMPARYRPLERWIADGLKLVKRIDAAARREGVDLAALQLKLDGRPTSLARSLEMARHNLVSEYPRLMRLDDPYTMLVAQASNLNDQYRLGSFLASELVAEGTLREALAALNQHLLQLPQIDPPGA